MNLSYILIDGGDVEFFASLEQLERHVESPDIESYEVFDSAGQVIRLTAEPGKSFKLLGISVVDVTQVYAVKTEIHDAPRLLHCLREYARRVTHERHDDLALASLLQLLVSRMGYA